MVWSNWKRAIWRGAAVVVLFWSGLAWTQTTQRPAGDPAERIMVVHENGKSTRCRVLESWQLPDGKVAHLLEAVETSERITIVDELAPSAGVTNPRAMPKRIFNWGPGRRTPPEGSPVPPQLQHDTGVVIKNETPSPAGAKLPAGGGPMIVNQVDEKANGKPTDTDNGVPLKSSPKPVEPVIPKLPKADPQVVDFHTPMPGGLPTVEQPKQLELVAPKTSTDPLLVIETPSAVLPQVEQPKAPFPPPPSTVGCDTICNENCRVIESEPRRGWRLGANLISWLQGRSAPTVSAPPASTPFIPPDPVKTVSTKTPFSTAMSAPPKTDAKMPASLPLAIPKENPTDVKAGAVKPDMWGTGTTPMLPDLMKLPAPPAPKVDPLTTPERLVADVNVKAKATVLPPMVKDTMPPAPELSHQGWPLGTQSVAAAKNGLVGPLTYVPVPTVTVPQPHSPPMPPPPVLPDAPNLTAYVNAFTPPPTPKVTQPPSWQTSGAFSNPMAQQQMIAYQQQMLAYQQQMQAQQMMMQYYRPNPQAMSPMPSTGPMANFARHYVGPMPPNPTGQAPMPYPPMQAMQPQPQPALQPVQHQQVAMQPPTVAQQVDQLLKVLRESPYPAQREWAAQSLTSYDWRAQPQIVSALVSSAGQDPAGSVRAGCVYCLGRMGASVESVRETLHSLRNDSDPRVRQEVDQAFVRLGQTPQ
jgi:hypothetical protein